MKNILIVGLLIAGCLGCWVAGAAEFKINKNGELLVARWVPAGVEVTSEAQKYPQEAERAFLAPGKTISVRSLETTEKKVVDLFHWREDTVRRLGVKYYARQKLIDVVSGSEIVGTETLPLAVPIFWVISVGAFSFLLKGKGKSLTAPGTVGVVLVSAISLVLTVLAAAVFSALSALSALIATVAFVSNLKFVVSGEHRKGLSACIYALMVLSVGLVYYPLFF